MEKEQTPSSTLHLCSAITEGISMSGRFIKTREEAGKGENINCAFHLFREVLGRGQELKD